MTTKMFNKILIEFFSAMSRFWYRILKRFRNLNKEELTDGKILCCAENEMMRGSRVSFKV